MSLRGYFATSKSHKISPLVLFPLRLHLCRVRLWTPSHLFHTFCTHPCPLHFLREKWEKLKTKIIEKKTHGCFPSFLPSSSFKKCHPLQKTGESSSVKAMPTNPHSQPKSSYCCPRRFLSLTPVLAFVRVATCQTLVRPPIF